MKINKKTNFISFIIFILILLISVSYIKQTKKNENLVFFIKENKKIILETAKTEEEQEKGLMYRKEMPDDHGMIFLFDQPQELEFWMKNTLIPLDMIFLNENTVIDILKNVPPCKTAFCPFYSSSALGNQVIELNGGMSEKLSIHVGDKIETHPYSVD